jgi:hypothetical protein
MVLKKPSPMLTDEVEGEEGYLVAGHQGKPEEGENQGGAAGADDSRAHADAAHSQRRSHRSAG